MITLLTCSCGGAEEVGRSFMRDKGGRSDWLTVPHYKGKDAVNAFLADYEMPDLKEYVKTHGKFTIILGQDDTRYDWRDIGGGGNPATREDAALILQNF